MFNDFESVTCFDATIYMWWDIEYAMLINVTYKMYAMLCP